MKIGIVGAGNIGATVGRLLHRAGHDVFFGSRHPEKTTPLVQELGSRAHAGTAEQAAKFGEVVMFAVPLQSVPELARQLAPLVANKVVIDADNAYPQRDGDTAKTAEQHPGGSSGWLASQLPGAKVVKAFNSLNYKSLLDAAHRGEDRVGIPIAGDDAKAMATAEQIVRDAGFAPVAVGSLAQGKRFEPGTAVYNTGMRAKELTRSLAPHPR
jgi:predicted dinucleotide-binding enzyme